MVIWRVGGRGLGVVGSGRRCQVLSRIVRLVGEFGGVGEGVGGGFGELFDGRLGLLGLLGGDVLEVAEGEPALAEEGDGGGDELFVQAGDVGDGDALGERPRFACGAGAVDVGEGADRAVVDQLLEEGVDRDGVVDGHGVGEGLGDFGVVGVEAAEVVVDGGVGDAELFGDLAERFALVVEQLDVDDAGAALGGEVHGPAPVWY